MHPLFESRYRLLLYILLWMGVGLWYGAEMQDELSLDRSVYAFTVPHALVLGFMALSAWYWCRAFPVRTTPLGRLLTGQIAAVALSLSVWTALGGLFFSLMVADVALPWSSVCVGGGALLAVMILFFYLMIEIDFSRDMQKKAVELQFLNRDAQLRALRMQINPHFLFNCLNSISALTTSDPAAARRMTILLAEFFRNSLRSGEHALISFRDELQLTRQYLDIEKIRFGDRLALTLDIQDSLEEFVVPPLILQPILENAVKHGVAPCPEGGSIDVRARQVGDLLEMVIVNTIDPTAAPASGNRMGLRITQDRLATQFGKNAVLTTDKNESTFRTTVRVPHLLQEAV